MGMGMGTKYMNHVTHFRSIKRMIMREKCAIFTLSPCEQLLWGSRIVRPNVTLRAHA